MKSVAINAGALLAGVVGGSLVNIWLVNLGPAIIPLPDGADVSTMESLRDSMKLFTPVNFLVPFLAHALGTLVGAFIAAKFSASHPMGLALAIGVFFLAGGTAAVSMIGGPMWFNITDLVVAYLPMGYLGAVLAGSTRSKEVEPTRDA